MLLLKEDHKRSGCSRCGEKPGGVLHLTIEVPTRNGICLCGLHWFVSLEVQAAATTRDTSPPFVHDGHDGHNAVHWLARNAWRQQRGGDIQRLRAVGDSSDPPTGPARHRPGRLGAPGRRLSDGPQHPKAYVARWMALRDGRRMNDDLQDSALCTAAGRALIISRRPYRDLDVAAVGKRPPVFQEWPTHSSLDDFWMRPAPVGRQYDQIMLPVLTTPASTATTRSARTPSTIGRQMCHPPKQLPATKW